MQPLASPQFFKGASKKFRKTCAKNSHVNATVKNLSNFFQTEKLRVGARKLYRDARWCTSWGFAEKNLQKGVIEMCS